MKKDNSHEFEIDDLLKETLKDDLPPESENRMKKQLALFRKKVEQPEVRHERETGGFLDRLFQGGGIQRVQWVFIRSVLACVSITMVVLGGVLQISGSHNSLTENISTLGTSISVSDQLNHTRSMECSVLVPVENDDPLKYSIQWLSPNKTRVQIIKQDKTIIKTIWLSEEEITIADHIKNTLHKGKNIEHMNDSHILPVKGFLSPFDLVERMGGNWLLKQYTKEGECEWGTFTVSMPEEKALLEMTVDLCTYLPVSIKKFLPDPSQEGREGKILMTIHFRWNTPIPSQLTFPKGSKESQCV